MNYQCDLFGNVLNIPETEGIKYTGSKLKILPYIIDMVGKLEVESALDAFSGTTRVAQAFSQIGYNTTANDISVYLVSQTGRRPPWPRSSRDAA